MDVLGMVICLAGLWLSFYMIERLHGIVKKLSQELYRLQTDIDLIDMWVNGTEGQVSVLSGKLTRSTEDAACWDIYADVDKTIYPGESVVIPTGIRTKMYEVDALLFDRSGLAAKFRITRRAGVIDSKYPDEWGVVLVNEGRLEYNVKKGDRIAQAMFVPKFNIEVIACGDSVVETSDRVRESGFGSTGK